MSVEVKGLADVAGELREVILVFTDQDYEEVKDIVGPPLVVSIGKEQA